MINNVYAKVEQIFAIFLLRGYQRTDVEFQFVEHRLVHNAVAIYQMAEAFVYPSRFEGFGIPIIEALHSSVPVIAATGSCLEEAGGPDSIYVHPDDTEGMAAALTLLLEHPERRSHMAERGKRYVARFSGERQAERLVELYRELLRD